MDILLDPRRGNPERTIGAQSPSKDRKMIFSARQHLNMARRLRMEAVVTADTKRRERLLSKAASFLILARLAFATGDQSRRNSERAAAAPQGDEQ